MVYKKGRPKYMTYGALGFWIGHEISHGFDTKGRHYNKDGNLDEWWDAPTARRYGNSACVCGGGEHLQLLGKKLPANRVRCTIHYIFFIVL